MIQNANASDNFLDLLDTVLEAAFEDIGRIADNSSALGNTIRPLNSNNLSIFLKDLVDISVQHESSTVNSTNSRKTFRNTSQTENGIDERTGVLTHRVHIELNFTN